ncbi:MAG: hypothetical protein RIT03_172 [Bacteroidota bacterium]|jgi:hypothetical protein
MELETENSLSSQAPKKKESGCMFYVLLFMGIGFITTLTQHNSTDESSGTYVKPYHTRAGKLIKGHVRKAYSTYPNAQRSRNNSKKFRHLHPGRYDNK